MRTFIGPLAPRAGYGAGSHPFGLQGLLGLRRPWRARGFPPRRLNGKEGVARPPGNGPFEHESNAPTALPTRQPGQQTGSKRLKSASLNHAGSIAERSETRMNRAIARPSSPIVVTLELACHAGGRGFESRRSRRKHPANRHLRCQCRRKRLPVSRWPPGLFRMGNQPRAPGEKCCNPAFLLPGWPLGEPLVFGSSRADPARA